MNVKRVIIFWLLIVGACQVKAQFSGNGLGTAESPYLITTALNVEEIRNYQGVKGVQFRLMNDIDMTELIEDTYGDAGWNPIPDFQGVLDGNGYTISGLFINRPSVGKVGFFSDINSAYIHDLILVYSGDIVGYISKNSTSNNSIVGGLSATCGGCRIERCMVKGKNLLGAFYVGGLLGYSSNNKGVNTIVSECIVEVLQIEVKDLGKSYSIQGGGLIGFCAYTNIADNRVNAEVVFRRKTSGGDSFFGGIVGWSYGGETTIINNIFEGKISAFSSNVGGIIGSIDECVGKINSNVVICDSIIVSYGGSNLFGRIASGRGDSNYKLSISDPSATNANRAYNKTVIKILTENKCFNASELNDSKENGLSVGNILLKNTNMYKSMGWDMENVWAIDEGNSYPRLKWEVDKGLSKPILTVKNNEIVVGENDVISFLADKVTTDLGGGVSFSYYQCMSDDLLIVNTSNRTLQMTVTITSQDYSHLKWAGIDGQSADMKESSESRSCQLERGATIPLKLHAVFADQDFGSYSAIVNVSCEDYSRTFQITFTNENPNKPVCPTPVIDYLEGKLMFSCDVEGAPEFHVNITNPDVNAHIVEHELELERSYTIEVYATADGYQASETSKLILCWVDAKVSDSVEGIISEKGIPLKIRMNDGLVTISGVENNTLVSAYSLDGILLDSITSESETVTLTIPALTETIVLKVGESSVKVIF